MPTPEIACAYDDDADEEKGILGEGQYVGGSVGLVAPEAELVRDSAYYYCCCYDFKDDEDEFYY